MYSWLLKTDTWVEKKSTRFDSFDSATLLIIYFHIVETMDTVRLIAGALIEFPSLSAS